ncbi:heavy-metal-associated domain-containing protein [Acidobacteriia bacterium AH_259_A11_L15]|nr:heavy-metal-associated domain-containing protein [Acidobacteriia bacterium AH_259_A11_L15]
MRKVQRGFGFVQLLLALVVILVLTMVALKMYQRSAAPAVSGGRGHPARNVLDRVDLRIEGLASEVDALQVTQALRRVQGVAAATTDVSSGVARVTFSPAQTNREQLVAAVERAGFRVAC